MLGYGNCISDILDPDPRCNIGDDETPTSAGDVDVGGTVVQLAAGGHHTCALLDTGAGRCWGRSSAGVAIGDDEAPSVAPQVAVDGRITQLVAGFWHTCALLDTGAVHCWGEDSYGQLGYGGEDHAGAVPVGGNVIALAAGAASTCALLETGSIRCWGQGISGLLGYGNTANVGDDETPASVGDVNVGGTVIQVAAGDLHTCVLLDTGSVRCWGYGGTGRLGYGNSNNVGDDETPASAGDVDVGGTVVQIAAHTQTCALLDTGDVRCWGDGDFGQLGYGSTNNIGDDETPASVGNVEVGGSAVQLSTGYFHTCALLNTAAVRCWGDGSHGRLGHGDCVANDGDSKCNIGDDETPATADDVPVL